MSSSDSDDNECTNKRPINRSYKQNPNKNKNIHPRTAQRWKSKLDFGINAGKNILLLYVYINSYFRSGNKALEFGRRGH